MSGANCINTKTKFYEAVVTYIKQHLDTLNLNKEDYNRKFQELVAEVTDKIEQPNFLKWYGNGQRDIGYGYPKIVDEIYLVNEKGQRITFKDLFNDETFNNQENYKKELTEINRLNNFFDSVEDNLIRRISKYRNSNRGKENIAVLNDLLEGIKQYRVNDAGKTLNKYYEYVFKTLNEFDLRYKKYDVSLGTLTDRFKNNEFKNYIHNVSDFLSSFENINNLNFSKEILSEDTKKIIDKLVNLQPRIQNLIIRTKEEIKKSTHNFYKQYNYNEKEIKELDNIFDAQEDEKFFNLWLDAFGDSTNRTMQSVDKAYKKALYDGKKEGNVYKTNWKNLVDKYGGKKKFDEKVQSLLEKKGTGRFIGKYKKEYNDKIKAFLTKKRLLEEAGKRDTIEYIKLLDEYFKFKAENSNQKYTKEYYDTLNSLIPEARIKKQAIDEQKHDILEKGWKNLSFEEVDKVLELEEELNFLKSRFNKDGTEKIGKDLEIANSLYNYSKNIGKFYEKVGIDKVGFEKARKFAEEQGYNYYTEWLQHNTRLVAKPQFWEAFNKVMSKMPKNEALDYVKNEINQLVQPYRNEKGEIKYADLPDNIKVEYDRLQVYKKDLQNFSKDELDDTTKAEINTFFEKFVEFIPTDEYNKEFARRNKILKDIEKEFGDASDKYKKALEEYKKWYGEEHYYNKYVNRTVPLSHWTKLMPKQKNLMEIVPNRRWEVYDIKKEYLNKDYEEDMMGFPSPNNKWINPEWTNLTEEDKKLIDEIKTLLYVLTSGIQGDITKKGFIFAIPKNPQANNEEKREIIIDELGNKVQRISFKYLNLLADENETNDLTDETPLEEIEKFEKENREKREGEHGKNIRYTIAEDMNIFIDEAMNYKYKKELELDLLLLKKQLADSKVKKTTPKGNTWIDKIASNVKGEKVEHEEAFTSSNISKHFEEWLEGVFYEKFNKSSGNRAKIGELLLSLSSFSKLGWNLKSIINNAVIGNITERIEAVGGYFFNNKDLTKADGYFFGNIFNIILNYDKPKSNNIVEGIIKKYNILQLQDELAQQYEKNALLMKTWGVVKDSMFLLQHVGEFQIQNRTLLAMLNSHRIVDGKIVSFNEFWEDRKGKYSFNNKITDQERENAYAIIKENYNLEESLRKEFQNYPTLLEAQELDSNGQIKFKDNIKLNEDEDFNFRERVLALNQQLHGIYNQEDAAMLQRYILGRIAMQFKKYMRPAWNRRFGRNFGKSNYNNRLRAVESPMYIDTFKFLLPSLYNNFEKRNEAENALKLIYKDFDSNLKDWKLRWYNMSEVEKAGVRRTGAEMGFTVMLIALGMLLVDAYYDDDDDDDSIGKTILGLIIYECDRAIGELNQFSIGIKQEYDRIKRQPSAAFGYLGDIWDALGAILLYPVRNEENNTIQGGIYHGESKPIHYTRKVLPIVNQYDNLVNTNRGNDRYGMFRKSKWYMQEFNEDY